MTESNPNDDPTNGYGFSYYLFIFLSVANFVLVAIEVFIWGEIGWALLQALVGLTSMYVVQYMRTHYPTENTKDIGDTNE